MSQILSLNTECHILPVSRGHLRDRRDFIVLFQFTLDIAESRLYGNGTSPLQSSAATAAQYCSEWKGDGSCYAIPNPQKEETSSMFTLVKNKGVTDIKYLFGHKVSSPTSKRSMLWYLPTSAKIMDLTLLPAPQKGRSCCEGHAPHSAWTERKVHKGTAI